MSSRPAERPAPRESTRTHAYPSGTHFSGSAVSQFWYRLDEPATASGYFADSGFHMPGNPVWKARLLAYGPCVMITGYRPSAEGRYTSARSTVPSGIGTGTSQSMRMPSLTSLRYSPMSIGLLAFGAEDSPGTTAPAVPPVPPASHLTQME